MQDDEIKAIEHEGERMFAAFKALRSVSQTNPSPIRAVGERSMRVYLKCWMPFVRSCAAARVRFEDVSEGFLESYLKARVSRLKTRGPATNRHLSRILRTIASVLEAYECETGRTMSSAPAALLCREPFGRAANKDRIPLPKALTEEQVALVNGYLDRLYSLGEAADWKRLRTAAMVGLALTCGIKQGELCHLKLSDVTLQPTLRLNSDSTLQPREVVIPSTGSANLLFQQWLERRQRMRIPGPFVFPSTLAGKPLGDSTALLNMGALLNKAGLGRVHGTALLRNSYFVRELTKLGRPLGEIALEGGVADLSYLSRFLA